MMGNSRPMRRAVQKSQAGPRPKREKAPPPPEMVPLSQGAAQNIAQRRAALGIAQQDLNSYVLGIIDGLGRTPNTFQRIVDDENGMPQLLAFGPAVPSLPAPGPSPIPGPPQEPPSAPKNVTDLKRNGARPPKVDAPPQPALDGLIEAAANGVAG